MDHLRQRVYHETRSRKLVRWLLAGAGAAEIERWGPRPVVVLADCASAAGELPAGTEAWVRPSDDGRFRVSGSDAVCDREAVALVFPQG